MRFVTATNNIPRTDKKLELMALYRKVDDDLEDELSDEYVSEWKTRFSKHRSSSKEENQEMEEYGSHVGFKMEDDDSADDLDWTLKEWSSESEDSDAYSNASDIDVHGEEFDMDPSFTQKARKMTEQLLEVEKRAHVIKLRAQGRKVPVRLEFRNAQADRKANRASRRKMYADVPNPLFSMNARHQKVTEMRIQRKERQKEMTWLTDLEPEGNQEGHSPSTITRKNHDEPLQQQQEISQASKRKKTMIEKFRGRRELMTKRSSFKLWKYVYRKKGIVDRIKRMQIRLVTRVFSAWWGNTLRNRKRVRIATQKQHCKLVRFAWHAWRSHTVEILGTRESMKMLQKKQRENQAVVFCIRKNLFHHFRQWRFWMTGREDERVLQAAQERRRRRVKHLVQSLKEKKCEKKVVNQENKEQETKSFLEKTKLECKAEPKSVSEDILDIVENKQTKYSPRRKNARTTKIVSQQADAKSIPLISSDNDHKPRKECKVLTSMKDREQKRHASRAALKLKYAHHEKVKDEQRALQAARAEEEITENLRTAKEEKLNRERQIRQTETDRIEAREAYRVKWDLARLHNMRRLLLHTALRPWKHYLERRKWKWTKAEHHYEDVLLQNSWNTWGTFLQLERQHRHMERKHATLQLQQRSQHRIRRECFEVWFKFVHACILKKQRAYEHYERQISKQLWSKWIFFHHQKIIHREKTFIVAQRTFRRIYLQQVLSSWRNTILNEKERRCRAVEKEETWCQVREWLKEL